MRCRIESVALTLPSVSLRMNLYSKVVPAGRLTFTVHTGYDAAESAIYKPWHSIKDQRHCTPVAAWVRER